MKGIDAATHSRSNWILFSSRLPRLAPLPDAAAIGYPPRQVTQHDALPDVAVIGYLPWLAS